MKKLLALLLTLALAFTLALPAFAEDPDPAMPVITRQPKGLRVRNGESFTLSVEATIPNGDEIGYQWYIVSSSLGRDIAKEDTAELTATIYGGQDYPYYVEVYNRSNPELRVKSNTVHVIGYFPISFWLTMGGLAYGVVLPSILFASFVVLFQRIVSLFQ